MFSLMPFFNLLSGLWNNKTLRKFILILVFSVILFIFWNKVTDKYYQQGIQYQKTLNQMEQDKLKYQYESKLKIADQERLSLNADLVKIKSDYAHLLLTRKDKQNTQFNEVKKYAESVSGSSRSLDSEWVRIYKDSLPE